MVSLHEYMIFLLSQNLFLPLQLSRPVFPCVRTGPKYNLYTSYLRRPQWHQYQTYSQQDWNLALLAATIKAAQQNGQVPYTTSSTLLTLDLTTTLFPG